MRTRHNTLLIFSKVPEVGKVKTRLSVLKDGIFAPEDTCNLFHRMLFDVVEVCCAAIDEMNNASKRAQTNDVCDEYELVISTTPARNVEVMKRLFEEAGTWPYPLVFDYDEGANFDEHYNGAFNAAWARGADVILSFGADMPALTVDDVVGAFRQLHQVEALPKGGVVLSPDQEMGVSMVGWTRSTVFDHSGVYYCRNGLTVLPAYIDKARQAQLPVRYLPAVPDVDTIADLRHNATLVEALCYSQPQLGRPGPWRTQEWLAAFGWDQVKVMPNNLMDPRDEIDV